MKKRIIKLQCATSLVAPNTYKVIQLGNHASFNIDPGSPAKLFYVGDTLTQKQADDVASDKRFEVTIIIGKD